MKKITVIEITSKDLEEFLVSKGLINQNEKISDYALENSKNGISVSIENKVSESPASKKHYLEDLDISVRLFNCLKSAKINSMEDLVEQGFSWKNLRDLHMFGDKSEQELKENLDKINITLPEK